MHLVSRIPSVSDFEAFFNNFYPRHSENHELRRAVAHEWRVLLESAVTLSLLVEDVSSHGGHGIVGCAQLAFVSEDFVRLARRGERAWVNVLATHPMPDGRVPLLTPAEARRAQAAGDMAALITRWAWASMLSDEEQRQVKAFMDIAFLKRAQGYPYRELLMEAIGDEMRQQALASGFEVRADYAGYYRANPPLPRGEARPYLMGVTREEAATKGGHRIAHFFAFLPPRLGFSAGEQELLSRALRGDSDEQMAQSLPITLSGVKKRWLSVYERVGERMPELLPVRKDGSFDCVRGPEKRRRLLEYLREHPEELRTAGQS